MQKSSATLSSYSIVTYSNKNSESRYLKSSSSIIEMENDDQNDYHGLAQSIRIIYRIINISYMQDIKTTVIL